MAPKTTELGLAMDRTAAALDLTDWDETEALLMNAVYRAIHRAKAAATKGQALPHLDEALNLITQWAAGDSRENKAHRRFRDGLRAECAALEAAG